MRKHGCGLAVFTWLLVLGIGSVRAQTKVATVSLKPYGCMSQQELDRDHPAPDRKGWITSGPPGGIAWGGVGDVVVDGHDRVYVGLPIWTTGYAPKSTLRGTGDKLRVLVVNASAGAKLEGIPVERIMDFPTRSLDRLDLRLAADDTPIVVAGDKLMRLGVDGKPTAQLALPDLQKEFEVWDLKSSTTGRTIRVELNYKSRLLVDAQTLAVLQRCQENSDGNDQGSMTDDLELSSEVETTSPDITRGLEQGTFCQKRERLRQFGNISFVPALVDDRRFLAIDHTSISLRKVTGETLWTAKAPAGRVLSAWESEEQLSRNGNRVALRILRPYQYQEPVDFHRYGQQAPQLLRAQFSRNGEPRTKTLELEDTIAVWDTASGRLVANVPVQEPEGDLNFKVDCTFALSPDGSLLAILQDGVLVLWKLE
jgi:hypothetical protein